jgi:hypothetical protein
LAVIASIAVAVPLHAQQQATVKRNVNLRPTPSTAQAEIRTLQPPELLTGLDANPIQGYYNVRTSQGEEGFVWGRNITLGSLIAPMVAPRSDRPWASRRQPLARLLAEKAVCFDHALATVTDNVIVDGRRGAHDGVKSRPIPVCRPDFEAIFRLRAEMLGVCHERLDPHGRWESFDPKQLRVQCVQEQLQCGESLLTVDDGPHLQQPYRVLDLLQYHRSEEVRLVLVLRPLQLPVCHPDDVIPQRLPLVFLVPDIGALEQRDDQPLRLHEHKLRGADLRFHG